MYVIKKLFFVVYLFLILDFSVFSGNAQTPKVSNTLLGKVICGYQGWFNCYGDESPVNGWRHWSGGSPGTGNKQPAAGNITFEIYPELSEYSPACLYQTGLGQLGDGLPARLFSSAKSDVIDLHFSWMEQYGIDGVALQRFLGETKNYRYREQRDSVAVNVMRSSEKFGRIFYLMYDMSANDTTFFQNDILHIEKDLKIFGSPNYIHQDGKPVICLWGFGFTHRLNAPEASLAIIKWLKVKGYYVIGGVPTNWLTGKVDSYNNYSKVYNAFNMISPWSVGRFKNNAEADQFKEKYLIPDKQYCQSNGIEYQPVVFSGFAWSNWNGGKPNQIARNKGDFLWRQIYNIKSAGISNMYVAMFDEYDEGTAIAKMADSYFDIPTNQYFLTSSADGTYISSDFYLRLVGKATQTMKGELPLNKSHMVSYQAAPIWFRTSFEPGYDALPIDSGMKCSNNHAASGKWSLKVGGKTGNQSKVSTLIFEVAISISENTNLSYEIFPEDNQSKLATIELITTDGNHCSIPQASAQIEMNHWNKIEMNLGQQLKGKTIIKIAVLYESGLEVSYIDNISVYDGKSEVK